MLFDWKEMDGPEEQLTLIWVALFPLVAGAARKSIEADTGRAPQLGGRARIEDTARIGCATDTSIFRCVTVDESSSTGFAARARWEILRKDLRGASACVI
jgi:hypothetical protein